MDAATKPKKRATGFPVALCGVISVNNYQDYGFGSTLAPVPPKIGVRLFRSVLMLRALRSLVPVALTAS
jgi:hypothetical protein